MFATVFCAVSLSKTHFTGVESSQIKREASKIAPLVRTVARFIFYTLYLSFYIFIFYIFIIFWIYIIFIFYRRRIVTNQKRSIENCAPCCAFYVGSAIFSANHQPLVRLLCDNVFLNKIRLAQFFYMIKTEDWGSSRVNSGLRRRSYCRVFPIQSR